MLEGLVAWVLNNYLGKYVENLNTDQLSVALLSGKVELENLPLRKDALRHLGLSVEIKSGFIGKVQLQVPVRQIRSAPWLIAIEKLYVVAAPLNLDEWDPDSEAAAAHERKVAVLDALEARWRSAHDAPDAGYYATSYSSWLSYGTGLLANIVENLQLKLNDVHIRYEDHITCAPSTFACGLTVGALTAESCDSGWRRGFTLLSDAEGCSFKLLELQELAVYWDPMAVPTGMMAGCSVPELTVRMQQTWLMEHRYLIRPASATARVRRERTGLPLRSRTRPRNHAHLTLPTVALRLTDRQYGEAVGCASGLERLQQLREWRALRPRHAVSAGARDWWIYALKCHSPHYHWTEPRPTWESCGRAARAATLYVASCARALTEPAATPPVAAQRAKDDYEWNTPLHILMALREVAMRRVPKTSPASTPEKPSSGRSMLVHWFPQWWGWYGAAGAEGAPGPEAGAEAPAPPPDLEEEILDVLADSLDNNTLLKRDTVFGKFEFELLEGCLDVCSEGDGDQEAEAGAGSGAGVELQFSAVCAGLEWRPRAGSHAVHVSLGAVCLRERITPATLFPVLVAPQGVIREGLSALSAAARLRALPAAEPASAPLFQLTYERKPFGINCDYKLWVKSASLEVVWCAAAYAWAQQWACAPWGGARPHRAYASVRDQTKARLITHWEHMMHPHPGERQSWHVELDISAPQILFVEDLCDRDAAVLVVDFGRLRLRNAQQPEAAATVEVAGVVGDEEDELFMTPCSTPPGSLLSPASPPAPPPAAPSIDPLQLHTRLYDRYKIELSDLQILVGKARDNWKYAHTKATSSLHLLDRFNISLQAERRVVATSDPQYPTATLCGSLPALVAHLSEQKLLAVRSVVTSSALLPDNRAREPPPQDSTNAEDEEDDSISSETEHSEYSSHQNATLLMVQFAIDQLSLEVQSRGRSIAEVQVCGVKAALTTRPCDVSMSLSVHSLLLVDALQTYGPDFELLVASHKHVGMDTASGSIRGSEPTSPTSPTSPASPAAPSSYFQAPVHALNDALNSLHYSLPKPGRAESSTGTGTGTGAAWGAAGLVDSEALIAVELCLVRGAPDTEDLRIANILFNNLDIIANQETIVELIGFTQRVMGRGAAKRAAEQQPPQQPHPPPLVLPDEEAKEWRTEITFDFHRLGVLLLRAAVQDGAVVARKVATATLSEAKIQATIGAGQVRVGGSLGGVQVVSLGEGAGLHTRVLAAGGRGPDAPAAADDDKALLFTISRVVRAPVVEASVSVHVASVWYTHSGPLLRELQSCLTEFKQYLANLARSIRAAAADMALGLVQPRDSLSLYANPRLAASVDGGLRRRTTSLGCSLDEVPDLKSDNIILSVSIELESPVVVAARAAQSPQVLVAHLGRMSLANRPGPPHHTLYTVHVRDISLATLDVSEKLKTHQLCAENMELIYDISCGKPLLHNTALQVQVNYRGDDAELEDLCEISGKVVGGLHLSARREQYEQLLETLRWVSSAAEPAEGSRAAEPPWPEPAAAATAAAAAVPTLRLDPTLRLARLGGPPPARPAVVAPLTVQFSLPAVTVQLRADLGGGERSLVQLTFQEFALDYERLRGHETMLQVSLHSITMEDLTKDPESKHRLLMVSHTPQMPPKAVFNSKSCPNFVTEFPLDDLTSVCSLQYTKNNWYSLPSQINVADKENQPRSKRDSKCGTTPANSPMGAAGAEGCGVGVGVGGDNLVRVSVHTRDPAHPHFHDKFNKVSKLTKVDFNCLNLVVSIDSWVTVLDFFGIAGEDAPEEEPTPGPQPADAQPSGGAAPAETGVTQTETWIQSLSVVLVGGGGEVCRALVSRVAVVGRADAARRTRSLAGRLGALALTDLTPRAPLWRERFRAHADHALTFDYRRLSGVDAAAAGHDISLSLEMGPVTYVHTKRFVQELLAFARDFDLLRRVIVQARAKVSVGGGAGEDRTAARLALRLRCTAPVIVLPVSGCARGALAAELHHLHLDNCFKRAGDEGTVSTMTDRNCPEREMLDVRSATVHGLTLWCARGGRGLRVRRCGPPLLAAPAHLRLHIEHNLSATHNVPDTTVQGTLTTLQAALDPQQYRLLRGVLAHNLAETVDDLLPPPHAHHAPHNTEQTWTTSSLKLDLQDVTLRLQPEPGGAALACINFIKSRLVIETYSDLSQDIDLVSQEILVSDTRYAGEPANRRGNVFTNIVQPMADHRHSVQAEVHARRRGDSSAYTILVNNMRLMAVLDWWEAAAQFIMQPPPPSADPDQPPLAGAANGSGGTATVGSLELKLNITDSQLVLVEDPSLWDTNAVILKSTTVITYRCADALKPVSCELNDLEVFSCVLGLEEETALSIVDPAALHVALHADGALHVALGALNLRLSYHDMRMFTAMLQSLPVQARVALAGQGGREPVPANVSRARRGPPPPPLAPRWPRRTPPAPPAPPQRSLTPLRAVIVNAECVTLCVIDDCLDSDVPLLEVTLGELKVEQDLRKVEEALEDPMLVSTPVGATPALEGGGGRGAGGGRLAALLSVDYYNRALSGWEPVLEPWRFEATWEYTLTSDLSLGRLQVEVASPAVLDASVTSSLIELGQLVRANWTADYYAPQTSVGSEQSPKSSPSGHRRRSPFVPYALRNHTGQRLWFTTLVTTSDALQEETMRAGPDDSWVSVRGGDTEPFSFGARRVRGRGAPGPLHRIALRLDGWAPPDPVCVDRVGVYFRHITHTKSGAEARIVFEVSLEGSARKLVTVRSALLVVNKLPHPVEVRVEHAQSSERGVAARRAAAAVRAAGARRLRLTAHTAHVAHDAHDAHDGGTAGPCASAPPVLHPVLVACAAAWGGGGSRVAQVAAGSSWAAPLAEAAGALWVRPVLRARLPYSPAPAAVDWRATRSLVHVACRAPPDATYRFCCAAVRDPYPAECGVALPGHTLTLVPALRLENLLPLELQFRAGLTDDASVVRLLGTVPPHETHPFHEVNVEEGVELSVKLEGFGWSSTLSVGGGRGAGSGSSFSARLKLRDGRGRRLYLAARVVLRDTEGVKVAVSAPYWLVNRTGLPLVFRAEGGAAEAAGQFDEHEVARMVAPLLFSFAETDGGPTLAARLGRGLAQQPEWCSPFGLGVGVGVKRLEARDADRVYVVGVWVRAGRGRYRRTNIVTFTPRYQLHNNTGFHLQFAQKCTATTVSDPGASAMNVSAVAGCYLPWHWPRWEREQLLCVRVLAQGGAAAASLTGWSGGFRIDSPRALTLACREVGGGSAYRFIRVEVVSQNCSLFVVLSPADTAPPPLRIDNCSAVAVMFHQVGCGEECVVGAHGRALWALPEPDGTEALALRAPGGPRTTLPLASLPARAQLLYQNFIYIAFTATTAAGADDDGVLVLEVPLNSTRVVLGRKRYGDRSQLWRRGPNDQLIHEGSSPPQPTDVLLSDDMALTPHSMVLDIEEPAPRPGRAAALVLRRADPRRASTQAWRLESGGRMACAHANLCVQPDGGLMALVPGARVLLGLAGPGAAAAEHRVAWRTLRPGSGRLDVTLAADGPTRTVRICDHQRPEDGWLAGEADDAEVGPRREWALSVSLAGLGVSLVTRSPAPAELVHASFDRVQLELAAAPRVVRLALHVHQMQWDNQLLGTPSPVLLYCPPERGASLPVLHADVELLRAPARRYNAYFFKHAVVALRPLAVRLEERLILKLWAWAAPAEEAAHEQADEAECVARRVLDELTHLNRCRCYFELIKIMPSQVRLSMVTANKLEGELALLRRRLGLTLIKFEDAAVELEPFERAHRFDTPAALARQMLAHFKDELKWQAAKILGSVDFLGNPLGFVADVSEGVSGFLLEGNVGALFKNVTHGLSNSAAKVSESLGDGLERVVGDEAHEETRRRIRSTAAGAHLAAGFRGLGLGILGGVTSLVKHSYEGATQEGLPGFLAGVGKGLVGTVTKPVIGVLDLAAETASALRDTSRRADRGIPVRRRPPRLSAGPAGLLPRFTAADARAAELLYALNGHDYSERFLAYRIVRDTPHDIRALLSHTFLRIFTCKHQAPQVVMETHLGNLVACGAVCAEGAHFVELCVRGGGGGSGGGGGGGGGGEVLRRPRVQCDSAALAGWLARSALYARQLHHEHAHTLPPP